jgi:hypothetical protein
MSGGGGCLRHVGWIIAALALSGCAGSLPKTGEAGGDEGINAYPTNYKTDILAGMHAYLNDPTGIRDAGIAEPVLRTTTAFGHEHYTVCVRFNPKKSATAYEGTKEVAAVFIAGRFDQFVETPKGLCAGTVYAPFPELEKLTR